MSVSHRRLRLTPRYAALIGACLYLAMLDAQLPPASFYHIRRDERLLSSAYHCLAEDPHGFIWFGSFNGGGLYRFDGYDLRSFVIDPDKLRGALPSSRINSVFSFGGDDLYVGTQGGMAIMNLISGDTKCYLDDISELPDYRASYVEPMVQDTTHHCTWIGSKFGLLCLDWSADTVTHIRLPAVSQSMPEFQAIIDLLIDNANPNLLWLAADHGFFSYRIDQDEFAFHGINKTPAIVMDVYQNPSGELWIALDEKHKAGDRAAVMRYQPKTGNWRRFGLLEEKNVAANVENVAYAVRPAMFADELWVSTHTDVGLLNTNTGSYESWFAQPSNPNGLLENGFFRSMLADRHGRLWISSLQGIQYAKEDFMPPGTIVRNPLVTIIDVQVSNARADTPKPLIYSKAVRLLRDQRDITFRYVLPNPLDPRTVEYQYMLEGLDQGWRTTDQRTVQYTGLSGGAYTFTIKGREGNEKWTDITSLQVGIDKKLTEYLWFWIGLFFVIIAITVSVYRFMIFRTRKEMLLRANFDRKVSEIEMEALRAQMNPHFLFNSLNSIKYYAISKDKNATAAYLSKFALLVRTILNNSKSRTISLKDELEALRLYIEIEHLRLDGKFNFDIEIDSSLRVERAQIPPMVLQPYVENAIWHGLMHRSGGGTLKVQVKDMGGRVQCIIEDNGIGRVAAGVLKDDQHAHKQSVGMKITADRIALINRIYGIDTQVGVVDLYDNQGIAAGTRVIINIPIIDDSEE